MTQRPVFRPDPALPAHLMKTYQIVAPKSTHFRSATCEEVDCPAYLYGWKTVIDESTELGQSQAHYIRTDSGRRYQRDPVVFGEGPTSYVFEPGQRCFREHEKRLDKPEVYVVRDGDFRGNPRGTTPLVHKDPQAWIDDFGEHQDRLADQLERG